MAGGFDVTPSELHQAGATLRSVRADLSGHYPDLAQAIQDFCHTAGDTAQGLSQAVVMAGDKVDRAGGDYERAESANARATAGGLS